ncbi:hypothetical protein EA193_13190 [Escherichia coli]|uniref:Uncharacterized protein n=1 Tax=Escherichia coli TaxID=562 RepID=A0A641D3J6_ECOLX|nr:hypothetical protein EA193_13190 [Escherichia coli]
MRDDTLLKAEGRVKLQLKGNVMLGGVKIAEAFPEGRGSPHGCGLRARFTGMLPRARPGSRKG